VRYIRASMERPAVLLVEPEAELRRELARGLSRYHYEVVPAVGPEEGLRFAEGLGPSVVVADARLPGFGDASVLERWLAGGTALPKTLVLLAREPLEESDLPDAVRVLPAADLTADELVRKVRLVLLGRQLGVDADPAVESLVGDLEQSPPLELVRSLHETRFTGRLELDRGGERAEIRFEGGQVVGAVAERRSGRRVAGIKAFCRIGRRRQGPFHVRPGAGGAPLPAEAVVTDRVEDLVIRAVEEVSAGELPSPRSRLHLELGPAFFGADFSPLEQRLLQQVQRRPTAAAAFDALEETDGEVLTALSGLVERGVVRIDEPEASLYVVTDSTADLPVELARSHGIHVVPLSVHFGDEVRQDGVDLTPKGFYEKLAASGDHPTTSPPEPEDFLARYRELLARRDVVSVHISEKMSQTVVHARQAADEAGAAERPEDPDASIEVVDSGLVSLALGLVALFAARLAARGLDAVEVARRVEGIKERTSALFVVDTLEYLRKGGRIGAARALLGTLLGIKPILGIGDGQVVPVDKVRGGRAAHPRILELLAERADPSRPLIAAVAHANAPVWADRLRGLIEARFPVAEMIVAEIGPTVGAHGGPGTVGVAWLQPTAEELTLLAPLGETS